MEISYVVDGEAKTIINSQINRQACLKKVKVKHASGIDSISKTKKKTRISRIQQIILKKLLIL